WSSDVCSSDLDSVGFAQNVAAFLGHFSGDANRKAGAGERMAANEYFGQTKLAAKFADFILEQFAQRFDQLHIHAFGKTADIMMRFDCDARPPGKADTFDHVGVECALREEIRTADFFGFNFKDINEGLANEFALLFGVRLALQA